MSVVAIVLAAVAAGLLVPLSRRSARLPAMHPGTSAMPVVPAGRGLVVVAAAGAAAFLLVFVRGSLLALGLIVLAAALGAGRLTASARARKDAERREERVLEVCEVLVGELRGGQPPITALGRCLEVWPEFEPVSTAAQLGADVPQALRRLGVSPGAQGLRNVAGAWQVSQESGAGLAVALGQVATSAREFQATRRLVTAELASAQATARLMAGLPLVALALGSGIGGDPWQFLLATPIGLTCLASGLTFVFGGLTWIDRIAAAVMSR